MNRSSRASLIKKSMSALVIQQKMIEDVLVNIFFCKNLKLWDPNIHIDFVAN